MVKVRAIVYLAVLFSATLGLSLAEETDGNSVTQEEVTEEAPTDSWAGKSGDDKKSEGEDQKSDKKSEEDQKSDKKSEEDTKDASKNSWTQPVDGNSNDDNKDDSTGNKQPLTTNGFDLVSKGKSDNENKDDKSTGDDNSQKQKEGEGDQNSWTQPPSSTGDGGDDNTDDTTSSTEGGDDNGDSPIQNTPSTPSSGETPSSGKETSSSTPSTSSGTVPDGTWPTSTGVVKLKAPQIIKAGEVFDGKMQTFDRSDVTCSDGEGQKDSAVFLVEAGGTLKNAIIGKDQVEGVHCDDHDCTIENVWWDDVCEDALSVKGGTASSVTTVTNCGARSASDKVVQHNGPGTVNIDGFYAEEFGKLYRSCGTCGDIARTVTLKNVYAVNPLVSVITVNKNYGDQATLSNIWVKSSKSEVKVCQWSEGSKDPKSVGDGPSPPLCQYSESDVHINEDISKAGGSPPSKGSSTPPTGGDPTQNQDEGGNDDNAGKQDGGQDENAGKQDGGQDDNAGKQGGGQDENAGKDDNGGDENAGDDNAGKQDGGQDENAGKQDKGGDDNGGDDKAGKDGNGGDDKGGKDDNGGDDNTGEKQDSGSETPNSSKTDGTKTGGTESTTETPTFEESSETSDGEVPSPGGGEDTPSTGGGESTPSTGGGGGGGSTPSSGGGTVPDGTWPTSTGTVQLTEAQTVKAGEVFDGKMQTYERSDVTCSGQKESGSKTAVFLVEAGGTLQNVIIGVNQMEGVHCDNHDCTIDNVWWEDVCEDALSVKGGTASSVTKVIGGGAKSADDKVVQHNGLGTVEIDGFYGEDIGKLYRSCGTCGAKARKVSVSNVLVVNPTNAIVTVNKNWGDEATLKNVHIKSSKSDAKVCQWSQGNADGEPKMLGDGPSPPLCQYTESDVHINGAASKSTKGSPPSGEDDPTQSVDSPEEASGDAGGNENKDKSDGDKKSDENKDKSSKDEKDSKSNGEGEEDKNKDSSTGAKDENKDKSDGDKKPDEKKEDSTQEETPSDDQNVTQEEVGGEAETTSGDAPLEESLFSTKDSTSTGTTAKCNVRRRKRD